MTELSAYEFSTLRDGAFTLSRGLGTGLAPILLVDPAGDSRESLQRLEHEFALRTELDADWAARPVELVHRDVRLTLVLEDRGGELLDRLLGAPLDVAAFLRIAIPLSAALGQVHARGLIHKDIKPANILVDSASGEVRLTGFGIASRLPREHQAPAPPEVIAGTLAYMAPEQTGRMNRSVDARSDLYALGVTFYEMLTGTLPFTASDPMEWVHAHIARQPVPPSERVSTVPGQLSAVVLRLLAKTAEDRYQTAGGLTFDLRRCLVEWERSGRIEPFPLGSQDASDRLLIPEQLYGRDREIDILVTAFDRVVARGTPELVLVSGYSGIGKSSVVHELHKRLVPPRGLFAAGKFDQYKRDIPYATLAQAFQSLIRPLLGRSDEELGRWRDDLRDALGPNAQLIVNLVPELEIVIGPQPPVPELAPQDAQSRFQAVFRRLIGVFARPEHPLALFLDDLQWLDAATLDLLEHLVTHPEVRHLLLVGAYRDNEVDASHPFMRMLAAMRETGAKISEIVLTPLGLPDVGQLVADAVHGEPARAEPLARLVHEKTGGNPFFTIQFVTALAEDGLLAFDPAALAWRWDIDAIRARSYTDNVVELMVGKLSRLPGETQDALKLLACLGNVADFATLTMMHDATGQQSAEQVIHAALWTAVRAGLLYRLERAYAFPHDRVQQAAYSLIPGARRAGVHRQIGRALLAGMTAAELEESLFDVANQLNWGAALLVDRDETTRAATINLRAARKARASAAFASAKVYLAAGMALLDETYWASQHELMFSLRLERAECQFLTGELDDAERLIAELLEHGASNVDLAAAYHLKVLLHVVKSENSRAVDTALTGLRLFGIDMPAHPTWEQVQSEYETVWRNLDGRPIESLIDLPLMTDPELQAAMRLLSALTDPAYVTDQHLLCLQSARMVNLTMLHGSSGASAHGYGYFGLGVGTVLRRYEEGFRFAKLGCDLVERHGFAAYRAKAQDATGITAFWTHPVTTALEFIRASFRTAVEAGDLTYACYAMYHTVILLLVRNDPLDAVWRESEIAVDFVHRSKFRDMEDIIVPKQRLIAAMQGRTVALASFSDAQFDEAAFEAQLLAGDRMPTMICWYWITKAKARYLAGDHVGALAAADNATPLIWSSTAHFPLLDYHYYTALAIAALHERASAFEGARWSELLTLRDRLREWADHCPSTFADKHALVSAEIARLEGRDLDAIRLYEEAVALARTHGFVQNEGLAHELAARFHGARGLATIAHAYWRCARHCYLRWGAAGKVRQLEQLHPELREDSASAPTAVVDASVAQLDLGAVVKASYAISGEIVLDRLIETLMTIALEHAGAERGLLILLRGDVPRIEAEARIDRNAVAVTLRQDAVASSELPVSLLHTVLRTRERVILGDAAAASPFAADAYFREAHARSVLCVPLMKQAALIGVLYLENSLAAHVFSPERLSVLELLSSQAAISLENARLYADLITENRERQAAEEALRASDERWRNLFEHAPAGIAMTGSDGKFAGVNPAFQQMVGYSEAELRNLSAADITHEEDLAITTRILAAHAAGRSRTPRFEKRYRRKDGGVIWADVSAFLVPVAGSTPILGGVVVDITERKRAEHELRRSEAALIDAQQISHTGSWRWNVATDAVTWSAELRRILAFDPTAPELPAQEYIARVHPEDRPAFRDAIENAVRERRRFEYEYRMVLADGSIRHLHSAGRPDVSESGELEFFGVVMDVTERRQAEEALRDAQAEFTRAARLTTMGELAASIAHEINQPLAAIVSNGAAGLRWLDRKTPDLDEARGAFARMMSDGQRAASVIRGLRALANKSGPQLTPLDIDEVVHEVLALTRSEVQRQGVVLRTDLAASARPVLGDRVQLQQVLLNLVLNALDAMKAVTAGARELVVSSVLAEPGGVQVSVEDSGPGLSPAVAARVFEPFVTTKAGGLGIGLSICRSIIDAHGGRLWMSPRAPRGTSFRFTVPAGPG